jgi:YVTN family beta-propeller protein
LALDTFGNVYIADSNNRAVKKWNPVSKQVTSPISSGLKTPCAVAVAGVGNIYVADSGNNTVQEWNAATQQVSTLVSVGLKAPCGVALDPLGNLYIANTGDNTIQRLARAYLLLGATSVNEGSQAGTDSVTVQALPAGAPLTAISSQPWLTITGTGGGAVGFSFTANTSAASRTATIKVDGVSITVTQGADTASSMVKTAGMGQTASPGQAFATALQVEVEDSAGQPVRGAAVTFTVVPGATGASGTFNSSPPMPIPTNASGLATAPALTANSIAGTFSVTVTVGSLTATFNLTVAP